MRYATSFDWLLVSIGIIVACLSGALNPSGCIVFRGITNALMKAQADLGEDQLDMEWFKAEMLFYIQMYFYLGITIFLLEYVAVSLHGFTNTRNFKFCRDF